MKRVLIVGNSHASVIYKYIQTRPTLFGNTTELYFYVIPGGFGPHLVTEGDKLILTNSSRDFPPYSDPTSTPELPISYFDAFVIPSLGYVDGGFRHNNPIITLGVLAEYKPIIRTGFLRHFLSEACYHAVVAGALESQDGFRFMRGLRAATEKPIAVLPCPYLSDEILERSDWKLATCYKDVEGVNLFFARAKDAALAQACDRSQATLFDYPEKTWRERGLTPRGLMNSASQDMVHAGVEYAALVTRQIEQWVKTI